MQDSLRVLERGLGCGFRVCARRPVTSLLAFMPWRRAEGGRWGRLWAGRHCSSDGRKQAASQLRFPPVSLHLLWLVLLGGAVGCVPSLYPRRRVTVNFPRIYDSQD